MDQLLALADVWQQSELAGTLDGQGELLLVLPGEPGDTPRPGLPPVGDEPPQQVQILVIDRLGVDPGVLPRPSAVAEAPAPAGASGLRLSLLSCHERREW